MTNHLKRIATVFLSAMVMMTASAKVIKTNIRLANVQSKQKVENVAKRIKGVKAATYSASTHLLTVSYDNQVTNTSKIRAAVKDAGYRFETNADFFGNSTPSMSREQRQSK